MLLFFLITNFFTEPTFSVASAVLFFIFSLEAVKFNIAARSLCRLKLHRQIDADATLVGDTFSVNLEVEHHGSKVGALLELGDLVPDGLKVIKGSSNIMNTIKGPQRLVSTYTLEAMEIGKKRFEGAEARIYDRLGLFVTYRKFACNSLVNVYPGIPSVYLEIPGRQRRVAKIAEKGSTRRSLGTEITGIREYIPGDDYRMIAWKSMAKSPTFSPMTKEVEQIRVLDVYVIFLSRPSMKDGTLGQRKIDRAVEASLTLASHVTKEGYSMAFIFQQDSMLRFVSGSVPKLARSITDLTFGDFSEAKIVEFLRAIISKRSLIEIVTDLPYPMTINLSPFQSLRLEGHLISIMTFNTPSFFERSVEKGEGERLAKLILDEIEDNHEKDFISSCSNFGLDVHFCTPNDLSIKMIETFTEARRTCSP